MSSARIDFDEGGFCNNATISRTMPAILERHMTEQQWNDFCNRLDDAIEPLNTAKLIAPSILVLIPIAFLFTVIYAGMSGSYFLFFLPVLIVFVGMLIMMCVMGAVSSNVRSAMERICDEESRNRRYISFHVRDQRYYGYYRGWNRHAYSTFYIDVTVAPSAATIQPIAEPVFADVELATAGGSAGGTRKKMAAERLTELENIRRYLTEKEYQEKRREILSSI